jgi:PKD repeat protein
VLILTRQAPGRYVGRGSFWVPLRCAGRVVRHGGRATETITVRITRTTMVGATRFATAVRATYNNPSRQNLTRCPGGIGHDAATYRGQLTSPLPGPPSASFTASPNPATTSATFTDDATPGRGGAPIVAWSWNFGDPSSAADTSPAPDPTHQYSTPGTYTVTLSVRDGYGQTATSSAQITV